MEQETRYHRFCVLLYLIFVEWSGYTEATAFSANVTVKPLGEHTTEFMFAFEATSEPTCLLDYGDGNLETIKIVDYDAENNVTYTHVNYGYYDFYVFCLNDDGVAEKEALETYVGDFVDGFEIYNAPEGIIPIFAPLAKDVDVDLRIVNGTNVNFTAILTHTNDEVRKVNATVGAENLLTFGQSNFSGNGLYTVVVSAENPITPKIESHAIIAIQEEVNVTSVVINAGTNFVEVAEPFDIELTLSSGEDVTIVYDIINAMNETTDILAFTCEGVLRNHTHSYQIHHTGMFSVIVEVSNMVSQYNETIGIVSEYAVSELRVIVADSVSFYTDAIIFTIESTDLLPSKTPAGVISCVLDFGNTNSSTFTFDLSNVVDTPVSQQTSQSYTAGFYRWVLICRNEIPTELILENDLRVENPVENIHLENSTDYVPISVGITVYAKLDDLQNLPLYLITCSFNFQDGSAPIDVIGNVTSTSFIELFYKYSIPDVFTITVNCSAHLSHQDLSIGIETYWNCWQYGLFFESYKSEDSPLIFFTHEPRVLKGNVLLTEVCQNSTEFLEFIWTFLGPLPDDSNQEHVATIELQTYEIPPNTLKKGKYKAVLNSSFADLTGAWLTDFMYIESILPDLVPLIKGCTEQEVKFGGSVLIDATDSFDPAWKVPGIAAISLHTQWACAKNPALTEEQITIFFASGSTDLSSIATEDCGVAFIPDSKQQTFHTMNHPSDVWYIFMFTMSRGERTKSAFQAIKPIEGEPLKLSFSCIANCHGKSSSGINKIGLDTVQTRVNILDTDVDLKQVAYTWRFMRVQPGQVVDMTHMLSSTGARDISIPTKVFEQGGKYKLSCEVQAPNRRLTRASEYYIVNLPPYDGNCTVDRTIGMSCVDLFCVTCYGWKDEGNRHEKLPINDTAGSLTYDYVQYNHGAPISEIVHKSTNQMKYCMDLVLPSRGTNTSTITVKIKDRYLRPEASISFTVTVLPAMDVSKISAIGGNQGAAQVQDFADSQARKMENALATGDAEKLSSIIASSMSNIADIKVEPPPPLFKEEVNDGGGGLIDFLGGTNGSKPVTSDKVLEEFNSPPLEDNTTIAMQDTIHKFTDLLTIAMDKIMFNTTSSVNPVEVSQNARAFLSVLSTDRQNINSNTTRRIAENIEKMSGLISNHKVPPDHSDTHGTLRDMQKLEGGLVTAVVPPALKKVKPVTDMVSAAILSQALYELADPETQALRENADMSIEERNFVLLKTQLKLQYEVRKVVDAEEAQKAADAFKTISDAIQQSMPQGEGHREQLGEPEDTITQTVSTDEASKIAGEPLKTNLSIVEIPGLAEFDDEPVTVSVTESKENIFMYDDDGASHRVRSPVSRLRVNASGTLQGPVKIQQEVDVPMYSRRVPLVDPDDASQLSYYITLIQSPEDLLCVVCKPTEDRIEKYTIYINYGKNPTNIDYVAKADAHSSNDWSVCFDSWQRPGRQIGLWNYGVRSVLKETSGSIRVRRETGNSTSSTNSSLPAIDMSTATLACMTWDSDINVWKSDACDAKWKPDDGILECSCKPTNNELTFGNSFYVPPNSIDFNSVFLKFSPLNQAAVMATLIFVIIVYILVILWARRQDKKDLLKWGITPLADNFPEDCYFYIVKVYTGMRPGAGTKSKVAFVLAGDEMDTGVRELSDGIRKEFGTGSILHFLLSTNTGLGQLEYIRIWHDNSGGGSNASWYLSKVEVQDIQLNETYIFQAERWLAVEKEDGTLECVVPVSQRNDLNVFKNRLVANAKDSLADNHVWVSIVYRPSSSSFTRVQRATCALVFLMLTMILNAIYFRSEENYETPAVINVGPFRFSLQQIYISIISALITTPPTILIIYLFKMSKRNLPKQTENLYRPRRARKYTVPFWDDWLDSRMKQSMELEQHLVAKGYPQLEGCLLLPHWCNYVAWFLAFVAVFLSAFFIMLYSMEWGKQKSEEWLTTFLLSFFESVLFLDPIKVAMMAFFFAIIFRTAKDSSTMVGRKTIMKRYSASQRGKSSRNRLAAPPLDEIRLEEARSARRKEIMMKSALTNVVINVFICWILFSISYSNRDSMSFFLHRDVSMQILTPAESPKFTDINSISSFFEWLDKSAIMRLFPENDVNGDRLHWRDRQFMFGGASFRLGPPRLRQLRTKKESCPLPHISSKDCFGKYYEPSEETESFCIGWVPGKCDPIEKIYKHSSLAWKFTSALDIWGFPVAGYYTTYGGGGYIALLDVNRNVSQYILNELFEYSWVDRQTRAVILEFTLYCMNTNIFMYNLFMVEFPETGGAFPFHILLPLRVYQHSGSTGIYTLACEIIFVIFLLILTVQMVVNMIQQKLQFFKKSWQVMDMVIVILGYLTIIMYGVRFALTAETISKFKDDKKQFVNFYHIAIWDQILVLFIGSLDFIVSIRLLNILGYNKRINAVAQVFSTAASDLLWFGAFFFNIFCCYAVFGYLLFGSRLKSYMNVYATMGTLFISLIGKSRFTEIEDANPVMSKIYFMIFIFLMVYCILSMFLAVLSKGIERVHSDLKDDKGEEMVEFFLNKFKSLIGYGREENKTGPDLPRDQPPAPWGPDNRRFTQLDNRSILQVIRMSLHEALKENNEEKEQENENKSSNGRKK